MSGGKPGASQGLASDGLVGSQIYIQEVGPRDGLQNEATHLSVAQKVQLVEKLAAAGLRRIEVGSFVHPRAVPQMADSDEVLGKIQRRSGVRYGGLVLNQRGFQRAVAAQVDEVHLAFGVTEEFNQRNQRASPAESFTALMELLPAAREQNLYTTLTLAVAFGCPFSGPVDPGPVVEFAAQAGALGVDEVLLADTIGVAVPNQVADLVGKVGQALPAKTAVGCHFHNTRNTGFANVYAALQAGATMFDAALGGAGGCPFAPGATGNIATEDLVYMLDGMGVETGVDLEALIAAGHWLEEQLERQLPGMLMRAGPFPAAG